MGNWRTVRIVGTCPPDQVEALREACRYYPYEEMKRREKQGMAFDEAMGATHCLAISDGFGGLRDWPAEVMDVGGNLFERNFVVEDVAETLEKLSESAPGLSVKVHCGNDWESEICIATVKLNNGKATVGPPEVKSVQGIAEDELKHRFF